MRKHRGRSAHAPPNTMTRMNSYSIRDNDTIIARNIESIKHQKLRKTGEIHMIGEIAEKYGVDRLSLRNTSTQSVNLVQHVRLKPFYLLN